MKLSQISREIVPLFRALVTLNLIGAPGSAKTAFVHVWAALLGKWLGGEVRVLTLLLTQKSAQELIGYMIPAKDHLGRPVAVYTLSNIQQAIEAAYAEGCVGVIVFMDEFLQALHPEQKAASSIMYDRKLGDFQFPDTTMVIMASNRPADGAGVLKGLRHNNNRVCTYFIEPDLEATLKHYGEIGMHPVFVACAAKLPEIFVDTVPAGPDADLPYCTFRSFYQGYKQWSYLSGFVDTGDTSASLRLDEFALETFAGNVGWSAARKVFAFTSMHEIVPSIEEIRKDPTGCKIPPPSEIGAHYYASQIVAYHADKNEGRDMDALFTFLQRLRPELLPATVQQLMGKEDTGFLVHARKMTEWIRKNTQLIGASVNWK